MDEVSRLWNSETPLGFTIEELRVALKEDPMTDDMIQYFQSGTLPPSPRRQKVVIMREHNCFAYEGILYQMSDYKLNNIPQCKVRLWLPRSLQSTVVKLVHFNSGHAGFARTLALMRDRFIFPQIYTLTKALVISCEHCQKYKRIGTALTNHRQLYDQDINVFQVVHIDFIGQLPSANSKKYVMVIVDRLTGYTVLTPLSSLSADLVCESFERDFIRYFGCPAVLISDNASTFTGHVFQHFLTKHNIKWSPISAYYSASNGVAESKNRVLVHALRGLATKHRAKWPSYLPLIQLYLNSTISCATNCVPQVLVTGLAARLPVDLVRPDPLAHEHVEDNAIDTTLARMHIARNAAREMKRKMDTESKQKQDSMLRSDPLLIRPGMIVYFRLPRLMDQKQNCKLQAKNVGPLLVLHVTHKGAVKLKNLETGRVMKSTINRKYLQCPSMVYCHANTVQNNLIHLSESDRVIVMNANSQSVDLPNNEITKTEGEQ